MTVRSGTKATRVRSVTINLRTSVTSTLEGEFAEAQALIQHLLASGEHGKAALARKLHDEIAELMVAALMDLSAAVLQLPALEVQAQRQLARAKATLGAAIDQSRRLVEELRPSLVEEVGLFTALKWQVHQATRGRSVIYTEWYPDIEPPLPADASIALFRVAEEALAMTFKRGAVEVADLQVRVDQDVLHMKFTDNGIPVMRGGSEQGADISLATMRYRLRLLGGSVDIERAKGGGTILIARLPL
jgi:signal transduction histidine kinase